MKLRTSSDEILDLDFKYAKQFQYISNYFDDERAAIEFNEDFYLPMDVKFDSLNILVEKFVKPIVDKTPIPAAGNKVPIPPPKDFLEKNSVPDWTIKNLHELFASENFFDVLKCSDLLGFESFTNVACIYIAWFYAGLSFEEKEKIFPINKDRYTLEEEKKLRNKSAWIFE
jgi:hypothetical protein